MATGAGMKVPEVKQGQGFRGNNSRGPVDWNRLQPARAPATTQTTRTLKKTNADEELERMQSLRCNVFVWRNSAVSTHHWSEK